MGPEGGSLMHTYIFRNFIKIVFSPPRRRLRIDLRMYARKEHGAKKLR